MAAEVFTKNGVEVSWPLCSRGRVDTVYVNKVLHLSYMPENEPFEKLPVPYRPVQERGHHPPRLSLGFAIRKELAEFRRVALKEGLTDPRDIDHNCFSRLAGLVLGHLNKICALPPGDGMTTRWIHSREGIVVIELETNYNWWIPEEKQDKVVSVIKEHFNLPKDAKPRWHPENDIDKSSGPTTSQCRFLIGPNANPD